MKAHPLHPAEGIAQRSNGRLRQMLEHAASLQRIDKQLRDRLPSPLKHHCRLANIDGATVIVQADSPVWANRLRFQGPALLSQLRDQRGQRFRDMKVRVRQREPAEAHKPPRAPLRLSEQSAAAIVGCAAGIRDAGLRTALRRLVRHVNLQTPEN